MCIRDSDIPGIARLKFVTNYPKDMTDDLLQAVRDLPKVSPYLHVPLQSGSDRILRLMKRGYTVAEYDEMMERIVATVPGHAISSDFIVGFCSETDQEFEMSVEAIKKYRFKNSFIFKYSERPGTRAMDNLPDDIPHEVKQYRNNELLAVQNAISEEANHAFIGQTVDVLVEGPSKKAAKQADSSGPLVQMTGRTHCDRIVVWEGNRRQAGQIMPVTIFEARAHRPNAPSTCTQAPALWAWAMISAVGSHAPEFTLPAWMQTIAGLAIGGRASARIRP